MCCFILLFSKTIQCFSGFSCFSSLPGFSGKSLKSLKCLKIHNFRLFRLLMNLRLFRLFRLFRPVLDKKTYLEKCCFRLGICIVPRTHKLLCFFDGEFLAICVHKWYAREGGLPPATQTKRWFFLYKSNISIQLS